MIISGALLLLLISAVTKNDAAQVVRLVDGDQCSGIVEVYHDGEWGTVCDDIWSMNNAEVVCREVGCGRALRAIGRVHYGKASGPIWLNAVSCSGSESSLKQCQHTGFWEHICHHPEQAAVVCSAKVVRLVNGDDQCSGRVEVYHDGQWGTVCDDHWDLVNADVVCKEVGCGVPGSFARSAHYELDKGPIWLDDVSCSGSESSLTQCQHSGYGSHDCSHKEDVAVVCHPDVISLANGIDQCFGRVEVYNEDQWIRMPAHIWDTIDPDTLCKLMGCAPALLPTRQANENWHDHHEEAGLICSAQLVRLVDGDDECSGRVEVHHYGRWGSVCDDHWDMKDADVVCREVNCGKALAAPGGAHFGESSGDIWLDDVRCSGSESSLMQCQRSGFGVHNCRHDKDAAVICSARVIRLVGGGQCSGRVEVFHEGHWGTVCDDYWGKNNAKVVCRAVGCGRAVAAYGDAQYGQGSGPIWLDDVKCSGNESSLTQCQHSKFGVHNCAHKEDAAVYCLGV